MRDQHLLGASYLLYAKEQMLWEVINKTAQAQLGAHLMPSCLVAIE